ncbi:MAG: cytochrome C oxidase subunit IV family protein [Steroidobacteraceae bacterium]
MSAPARNLMPQDTGLPTPARAVWLYLGVWAALLALLGLTIASAFAHLGGWNGAVNLIIAGLKAILVAVVFMRLREGNPLLRLMALAGVVWLMILMGLSLADFLTRRGAI